MKPLQRTTSFLPPRLVSHMLLPHGPDLVSVNENRISKEGFSTNLPMHLCFSDL